MLVSKKRPYTLYPEINFEKTGERTHFRMDKKKK